MQRRTTINRVNNKKEKEMNKKQWYETLFENYGEKYDNECFAQGTIGECDFIEKEINYNKTLKIIDIGCGTGRHSIELSKRGYSMTGIDLSESLLEKAREKAKQKGVQIDFFKHDARNLPFDKQFDVAIMMCEGGFPLMETDEMNYEILKNVSQSLKEKSKFIFTTLNGLFPIYQSINDFHAADSYEEGAKYKSENFDLMTFRDYNTTTFTDDDGNEYSLDCNERYYIPSEITWLLKSLGFTKIGIFGATLGAFSREDKLTTEDFEMLVIAEK
jgi:2-polyprenyl-3-methyl-5-hydroxy-6-metoxy-1,4-benzoquinol methylase